MEKGCSIRDLAQAVGVSPGTVSRVLNDRMGNMQVSQDTRKRIFQYAKEMDYQPNINARRLFSKQSRVLGLVIPSFREIHTNALENTHVVNMISGIEQVLFERKYKLMMLFKDREFIESEEYLTLFRSKQLDGLLIWGAYRQETFWNELAMKKYPHVFLTTHPDGIADPGLVFSADYALSGYNIMRYLLEKGYRSIHWGKPESRSTIGAELEAGFQTAFRESGLDMEKILTSENCGYDSASGVSVIEMLKKTKSDVSAVLFTSRASAMGAYEYCIHNNIRVPEDIAIAACDSSLRENSIRITCSREDDFKLGHNAVEALINKIENKKSEIEHKIPTMLIPGETA